MSIISGLGQGRGDALSLLSLCTAPSSPAGIQRSLCSKVKGGSQCKRWRKTAGISQKLNTLRKCQQPPLLLVIIPFPFAFNLPYNLLSRLPSKYHLRADCHAGAASSLEQRETHPQPGWGTGRKAADFTEKTLNITCVLPPAANSSTTNHNTAWTDTDQR